MKTQNRTTQMKSTEQYFPVVFTFESADENLKWDHSNESYRTVLSCGVVYYTMKGWLHCQKHFSRAQPSNLGLFSFLMFHFEVSAIRNKRVIYEICTTSWFSMLKIHSARYSCNF